MVEPAQPTRRELAILKVLWDHGEASVREVYEQLRDDLPIVQNTVQAFLRTMEDKGFVRHKTVGRTFIYRAVTPRDKTSRSLLSSLLDRVFDDAMDELVASAMSVRKPSADEIKQLRALLDAAEQDQKAKSTKAKSTMPRSTKAKRKKR